MWFYCVQVVALMLLTFVSDLQCDLNIHLRFPHQLLRSLPDGLPLPLPGSNWYSLHSDLSNTNTDLHSNGLIQFGSPRFVASQSVSTFPSTYTMDIDSFSLLPSTPAPIGKLYGLRADIYTGAIQDPVYYNLVYRGSVLASVLSLYYRSPALVACNLQKAPLDQVNPIRANDQVHPCTVILSGWFVFPVTASITFRLTADDSITLSAASQIPGTQSYQITTTTTRSVSAPIVTPPINVTSGVPFAVNLTYINYSKPKIKHTFVRRKVVIRLSIFGWLIKQFIASIRRCCLLYFCVRLCTDGPGSMFVEVDSTGSGSYVGIPLGNMLTLDESITQIPGVAQGIAGAWSRNLTTPTRMQPTLTDQQAQAFFDHLFDRFLLRWWNGNAGFWRQLWDNFYALPSGSRSIHNFRSSFGVDLFDYAPWSSCTVHWSWDIGTWDDKQKQVVWSPSNSPVVSKVTTQQNMRGIA